MLMDSVLWNFLIVNRVVTPVNLLHHSAPSFPSPTTPFLCSFQLGWVFLPPCHEAHRCFLPWGWLIPGPPSAQPAGLPHRDMLPPQLVVLTGDCPRSMGVTCCSPDSVYSTQRLCILGSFVRCHVSCPQPVQSQAYPMHPPSIQSTHPSRAIRTCMLGSRSKLLQSHTGKSISITASSEPFHIFLFSFQEYLNSREFLALYRSL